MKNRVKHLLCLSLATVLLIAGQACKKEDAKSLRQNAGIDFRDSLIGRYYCDKHDTIWGWRYYSDSSGNELFTYDGYDTVVGHDTLEVTKASYDTNSILIAGYRYARNDSTLYHVLQSVNACKPLFVRFAANVFYCETERDCLDGQSHYLVYYRGRKIY